MIKFRPLIADEIEVKVKKILENKGAIVLLYKTARADMELLDECVGAENWDCDYKDIKGNLYCGIAIHTDKRCITKWDCGIESREDGEGNEKKGEASDAFKRAGFKWGIGRQLYTSPFIWIKWDKATFERNSKGNWELKDRLAVGCIEYSEDEKRITKLEIYNSTTGVLAFSWKDNTKKIPDRVDTSKFSQKPPEDDSHNTTEVIKCESCDKEITGMIADEKIYQPEQVASASLKKYGKVYCTECRERSDRLAREKSNDTM